MENARDMSTPQPQIVLDWDGTVTERDTLDLVLQEFGDPEIYERVEAELGRTLTLNEVIEQEFQTVTAPLEEVVPWLLEHVRIRPGFAELARARQPLVVSSGFHELIEPVLEREGLLEQVELRANSVEARPDGWRAHSVRVAGRCGPAASRASAAPSGAAGGDPRSSMRATATPTSAPRSLPTGCSRSATSRAGWTSVESRTDR